MPYFDKAWLNRVAAVLETLDDSPEKRMLQEELNSLVENHGVIRSLVFSKKLCERLEQVLGKEQASDLLKKCSCNYPDEDIEDLKKIYERTQSVYEVHQSLKEKYEMELLSVHGLNQHELEIVQMNDWGNAGVLKDNQIVVTKVPHEFKAHFQATEKQLKAAYYCHCKRIKEGIKFGFELPVAYCDCGAGFYKHLWSTVLGQAVTVDQIQSILNGDHVCQFVITLPKK